MDLTTLTDLSFFITILSLIFGALHIKAEYYGPEKHIYIFKPLTTFSILLIAVFSSFVAVHTEYNLAIIIGLIFSLAGDVFLMLPSDKFIHGLISFLIAHVFYIFAFNNHINEISSFLPLVILGLYGIVIFNYIKTCIGKLKIPVMVYLLVILVMVFSAINRELLVNNHITLFSAIGAILFMISDSILAINKFKNNFKIAQLLILSTYYVAQLFIAWSIHLSVHS